MVLARWGLVPFFTKELSDVKGLSTINARAESLTKAPTWREPMKKRRCIVPASAFFEWSKVSPTLKQPYVFELANGSPLGFAGLWDAWKDKDGHWPQSFAIVTTEANELMCRIHPRMPAILHPRDYDRWLDREETERLPLDLLRLLESDEMEMFAANPKVGNVRNNGPELIRAAARAAADGSCLCEADTLLMSYAIDGRLLRMGSANWSPTGLKLQDNDVRYESSLQAAEQCEKKFTEMWEPGRGLDCHGSRPLTLSFVEVAGCG